MEIMIIPRRLASLAPPGCSPCCQVGRKCKQPSERPMRREPRLPALPGSAQETASIQVDHPGKWIPWLGQAASADSAQSRATLSIKDPSKCRSRSKTNDCCYFKPLFLGWFVTEQEGKPDPDGTLSSSPHFSFSE